METLKVLQAILDKAPEGATHKTKYCYLSLVKPNVWSWHHCGEWEFLNGNTDISEFEDYRSLTDIQRIVDLMKQLKLENEK